MRPRNEVKVTLKFGNHIYPDLPFIQALDIVRIAAASDKDGYDRFCTIEKDDEFFSSIANILGFGSRPTEADWGVAPTYIRAAERNYRAGHTKDAIFYLQASADACNRTHKKFVSFLGDAIEGGERGILLVEIINTTVILVGTGGLGEFALVARAGIAAGLKTEQKALIEGGKVLFDVEGKFQWKEVGDVFIKEFVSALLGGVLAPHFKRLIYAKLLGKIPPLSTREVAILVKKLADGPFKIKIHYVPEQSEQLLETVTQIAAVIMLETIHRIAGRRGKLAPKQMVSLMLDDWGNEVLQIVAMALKMADPGFRPPP